MAKRQTDGDSRLARIESHRVGCSADLLILANLILANLTSRSGAALPRPRPVAGGKIPVPGGAGSIPTADIARCGQPAPREVDLTRQASAFHAALGDTLVVLEGANGSAGTCS